MFGACAVVSGVEDFSGAFVVGIGHVTNAGFPGRFAVTGKDVVTGNLAGGEFAGAGQKLLEASGQFVRQGPDGNGAVRHVFHLVFADDLFDIEVAGKNKSGLKYWVCK